MNNYELTVILPGKGSDAKHTATLDRVKKLIEDAGGKIEKVEKWGKKELAYPIKKETEGVYHLFTMSLDPEKTGGINRVLDNEDQVLRHLIVKSKIKSQKAKL